MKARSLTVWLLRAVVGLGLVLIPASSLSSANDVVPPEEPKLLTVGDVDPVGEEDADLVLNWQAVTTDVTGVAEVVTQYRVYAGSVPEFVPNASNRISIDPDPATTSFNHVGAFDDENEYFYLVSAVDDGSIESNRRPAKVGPVAILSAGFEAGNGTLTWVVPQGELSGYRVFWGTSSLGYESSFDVGAGQTTATFGPLDSGSTYYATVLAIDSQGNVSQFAGEASIDLSGAGPSPPEITAMVSPPPNENGWNNSDVTVTFACANSGGEIKPDSQSTIPGADAEFANPGNAWDADPDSAASCTFPSSGFCGGSFGFPDVGTLSGYLELTVSMDQTGGPGSPTTSAKYSLNGGQTWTLFLSHQFMVDNLQERFCGPFLSNVDLGEFMVQVEGHQGSGMVFVHDIAFFGSAIKPDTQTQAAGAEVGFAANPEYAWDDDPATATSCVYGSGFCGGDFGFPSVGTISGHVALFLNATTGGFGAPRAEAYYSLNAGQDWTEFVYAPFQSGPRGFCSPQLVDVDSSTFLVQVRGDGEPGTASVHDISFFDSHLDCSDPIVVTNEGAQQIVSGTSSTAGGSVTVSVVLNIDKTEPELIATKNPLSNSDDWNRENVVVTFECIDPLSGVASCTKPQSFTAEGAEQQAVGQATDRAGNTRELIETVSIDKTAPIVTITEPIDGSTLGTGNVGLTGDVTDANDIVSLTCDGIEGEISAGIFACTVVETEPENSVTVEARDIADNVGTATVNFTVVTLEMPELDPHPDLVDTATVLIEGDAVGAEDVEIVGPTGVMAVDVIADRFSTDVPLRSDSRNFIYVTSLSGSFRSPTISTIVIHDSQAPFVRIDYPPDGAELTTSVTDVAGRVSDTLSGFLGLTVKVNGIPAIVDSGVGTNGTFFLSDVPLLAGQPTMIEAVAEDYLLNGGQHEIQVSFVDIPADAPKMEKVSPLTEQTAGVDTVLAAPIVVRVTHPDDTPFAGKLVTFNVIRSDGRVSVDGVDGSLSYQVKTDAQGYASAVWQLGSDSGCGNNRVEVTSKDIVGTVVFCASATPSADPARRQINVGMGNYQRVEVGTNTPEPLSVWVSEARNGLANELVTFTPASGGGKVNGSEDPVIVPTSSTGHAAVTYQAGSVAGPNVITASIDGGNSTETFIIQAIDRLSSQPTTFTGLVLDNGQRPIVGAECSLTVNGQVFSGVATDDNGRFEFTGIPAGSGHLHVNGLEADGLNTGSTILPLDPGSFPALAYEIVVVPNAENTIGRPVLLPPLDPANAREYSTSGDTTLTVQGVEGLKMTIKAGSMSINGVPAPDSTVVSLNQVHVDDVPMPMPDGAAPAFAWTLQPGGATFDPPVQIEYPNMSGLPAGAVAYFLSFNHGTGRFEIVSSATVTSDGASILSDAGQGIGVAGWGCNCPPYSVTEDCEDCFVEITSVSVDGIPTGGTAPVAFGKKKLPLVLACTGQEVRLQGHSPTNNCTFQATGNASLTMYSACDSGATWTTPGNYTLEAKCDRGSPRRPQQPVSVVDVEIEVEEIGLETDDVVQLGCEHPAFTFESRAYARVVGAPESDVQVVLTNPDGQLRFPAASTLTLTLSKNGTYTPFRISGAAPSEQLNEARIVAHLNSTANSPCAEEDVTVFHFEDASLILNQGGDYVLQGSDYGPVPRPAASFSFTAGIAPTGVPCSVRPVQTLRTAFMQAVKSLDRKDTYTSPDCATASWLKDSQGNQIIPSGQSYPFPSTIIREVSYSPGTTFPLNDGILPLDSPLYDRSALSPLVGCPGSTNPIVSDDSPLSRGVAPVRYPFSSTGGIPAVEITYTQLVKTELHESFDAFGVVYNQGTTTEHCALQQASWSVDVDSASSGQHADVDPAVTAFADPPMGPQANSAPQQVQYAFPPDGTIPCIAP